jgi:hypothetical protein
MEDRILKFIAALRAAGVRISLAESADAFKAVDRMGVRDRETFRITLQATLVKDAAGLPLFDELFPIFFGGQDVPPMSDLSGDLSPEEARQLAEALRQFNQNLKKMLERLLNGEPLNEQELKRLASMVGLNQVDNLRFREWLVQRMKKALRFREVQEVLNELAETLRKMGMNKERVQQLRQLLSANQQALEDQLRQYVGQRIAENLSNRPPGGGLDDLINQPFNALTDRDMDRLRAEVRRIAAVLRTRVALRQKRASSGQLDAKATIRANLKHGSVPIQLRHRQQTVKPKLVVLCDISTSMRYCSELMLSLLFAMQDQISKTSAFAFIDHLEFISPDFEQLDPRQAVAQVLARMPSGYYNTDLGSSLQDYQRNYLDTLDHRTTFILLGDGRNNHNDPRLDLFSQLARRSRRTIWLNPEAPGLWGTGDSDMLKYAPSCDIILHASTLAELTEAIDRLLVS